MNERQNESPDSLSVRKVLEAAEVSTLAWRLASAKS